MDMRFVIDWESLDKASRCCGFYRYMGKLVRHGSEGDPILWMNIGSRCGARRRSSSPRMCRSKCLNEALLLELNYLKEGLASRAEDRSDKAFVYNAYAALTACRILYSALHRGLVSKDQDLQVDDGESSSTVAGGDSRG